MNRLRFIWHRLVRRPAITGPMPFYIRRIPDGILLDLEAYFTHVIETLADDSDLLDLLHEIAEDRALAREHDGWEPEGLRVEQLADHIGYEVPVREQALARLADRLRAAVPPAPVRIPGQRREGGAAV